MRCNACGGQGKTAVCRDGKTYELKQWSQKEFKNCAVCNGTGSRGNTDPLASHIGVELMRLKLYTVGLPYFRFCRLGSNMRGPVISYYWLDGPLILQGPKISRLQPVLAVLSY